MRTEIARIQRDVEVTTIYVTHDQTEAMTMGDRVAVLKRGVLQQVDTPQALYDAPANLFVAGFIGSPAMNLVEATLSADDGHLAVEFGGTRLRVDDEARRRRPGLAAFEGRTVVLGIRPEDMEDAALSGEAPAERRMRVTVDVREAMGSEVYVHFGVPAPPVVTEDTRELAADAGEDAVEELEERAGARTSSFVGRLHARTSAREREPLEIVVDTRNLHFFDPATGRGVYEVA
jgi:multiple sugar transport system ATP-binding protein